MKRLFILAALFTLSFSNFSCTSDNEEDVIIEQTLMADDGDWGDDGFEDTNRNDEEE